MSEPLSVLIIGCGGIAGGYDERGGPEAVRTHAGAYSRDPRFQIRACVEPDTTRRAAFMAHWNIPNGYDDLQSALTSEGAFDIASLCVPTAFHGEALETLLKADVRCVFAEKPLTGDPARSRRIVDAFEAAGKPIAVNYLRRWDQRIEALRDELARGDWGKVQAVSGLYAKGLFNCASHFFDLLHYLVGPMTLRAILGRVDDGRIEDPTLSVFLETETGAPVTLIGTHGEAFFPFEIDLVMQKGRLSLEDLGGRLRCRRVRPHPLYLHQPTLDEGVWEDTGMALSLLRAIDNIHDHLSSGAELVSTGHSVLQVEELCAEIMQMAANNEGETA
jgi:predicted dehydrogenase